jgi:hypothetical protein
LQAQGPEFKPQYNNNNKKLSYEYKVKQEMIIGSRNNYRPLE